jgi:hypothetical protein
MKDDPAITAVREVRHRISESVKHDPRALVEYYRRLQQRHRDRLVSETERQAKAKGDAA